MNWPYDEDLEPCPFCGDRYILVEKTSDGKYQVGCNTLGCICIRCDGKKYSRKRDAIIAWNTRKDDTPYGFDGGYE